MSIDPDSPLEIGDDAWWREAERRVKRDLRRSRQRATLRRVARWIPHAVAVTALVVGAGWYVQNRQVPELHWPSAGSQDSPDPAETGPALLLPEELARDPFAGTPAEKYAVADSGIVLPPARTIGKHSVREVAAALATTKRLLVLSHLDDRALLHGDARPLQRSLAPGFNATAHRLRAKVPANGVLRLAPGQVLLARPRVSGTMWPAQDKYGELTVVTNYVFVYALKPERPVADRALSHVVVRAGATFFFLTNPRYAPADRGVWIGETSGFSSNVSCAASAKGMLALPGADQYTYDLGEGAEEHRELYRPDAPLPTEYDCAHPSPTPTPTPKPAPAPKPTPTMPRYEA